MADQITDNRTIVTNSDTAAAFDGLAGGARGNTEGEIFIEGLGSVGEIVTDSLTGILFDAGSAQDWSNNTFYVWINCGIVGLLDTQVLGGFRIRFCGATVTDFFEVYVGGGDNWPTSVAGGWTQFVVDIEKAKTAADAGDPNTGTGGTSPATSAIRYVGYAAVTATVMTKHVDNTWLDAIYRLPAGLPGIIVEGQNGGTTPWQWRDFILELGQGVGSVKTGAGGSVVLNTPVQFFIDDGTDHEFNDQNSLVLWDDQEWAGDDLYGLIVSGTATDSGTTDFQLGVSSSTGDDRLGSQGSIIAASTGSVRWFFSGSLSDVNSLNVLGSTFLHGSEMLLDNISSSFISTQFVDCTGLDRGTLSTGFVRNSAIDANTATGESFMTASDISEIRFGNFQFSAGHALEIPPGVSTPVTYSFTGNTFTNYAADDTSGSAIFNNTGGDVLINVSGGDTPSIRNSFGSSTNVQNPVVLTLTGIVSGSEVRIMSSSQSPPVELGGTDESSTTFTFNYTFAAGFFIDIVVLDLSTTYLRLANVELGSSNTSIPIQQQTDRVYSNP